MVLHHGCGAARFTDPHTVVLDDGTTISGERVMLCVGGHARRLPFPGSELALTHSDVWRMTALPRRVAIIGGAATGCQLAAVFAAFGSAVTLLDLAPRIVPGEDALVSTTLDAALRRRGIAINVGIGGVERLERTASGLTLHYTDHEQPATVEADAVILAVGWPGNLESLGLEAAGVETARGYVVVDDALRTSVPHIWAAGDITGRMMLVQSGTAEARVATENALRDAGQAFAHTIVPHGGFTDPEYGSVGLTEEQARKAGPCAVAIVPYADLDRAVIDGHTEGVCKLVVNRETHALLGVHVVGEQAVEVVQLVAAGMAAGMRVEQLAELELAYPTFTAILGLAARQLVRELGIVPVARPWHSSPHQRPAEWERQVEFLGARHATNLAVSCAADANWLRRYC